MTSGFEKPISIKDAINNIDKREYLLPALQRQFVWGTEQIEILFDSLMRDYPINSFMLWKVEEPSIKNNLKFYEFLKKYRQRYNELNPEFETKGYADFYAVIDGQQRLTSIYIGLKGSYAYKEYKKWWRDDEDCLPTRHLYLDLNSEMPEDNDKKTKFDFRFLTEGDLEWFSENEPNRNWYKVGDVITIENRNDLDNYIEDKGWLNNKFTKETIRQLWAVIHERPLINYYLERNQELATVLDIFIRTNSGGEPLSFSDLLMSVITASWKKLDARKEIPDVINKVFAIRGREFQINKDFVLKTCLVLLNDNIKFQIKNFDKSNVVNFEEHWREIKKAIITGFELLANMGLSNFTLRAKNAVIPIIYFIYHKQITDEISHPLKHKADKVLIQKWLTISLLKGVFGGQSDNMLTKIRKVIYSKLKDALSLIHQNPNASDADKNNWSNALKTIPFPFHEIASEFAADPSKNLTFDDAFIDELLRTQYEAGEAYLILSLLYPYLDYFNQDTHKDHLHNAGFFRKLNENITIIPPTELDFFKDGNNWNSILNLQMLNSSLNGSKNDKPLKEWVAQNKIDLTTHIIPQNISLDISNFKQFIEERKKLLVKKIKTLV
jgi:uncharacterized protein with ParB-like and HNH nuclease domain